MINLEEKTMTVHLTQEKAAVEFMKKFSWELKTRHKIYSQDMCKEEDFWCHVPIAVKTKRCIKLTFKRNISMENYAEIVELEKKYNTVPTPDSRFEKLGVLSRLKKVFTIKKHKKKT